MKPHLPAKEEILDTLAGVIADRTGVDLMLARSTAGDVLAALQAPGRSWGQRALGAQEAADVVGHELMEAMKGDLLIVFLERLGGKVTIPVAEIDTVPAGRFQTISIDTQTGVFTFENRRKQ